MPCYAGSELGLGCLHMSKKQVSSLNRVDFRNWFFTFSTLLCDELIVTETKYTCRYDFYVISSFLFLQVFCFSFVSFLWHFTILLASEPCLVYICTVCKESRTRELHECVSALILINAYAQNAPPSFPFFPKIMFCELEVLFASLDSVALWHGVYS